MVIYVDVQLPTFFSTGYKNKPLLSISAAVEGGGYTLLSFSAKLVSINSG